MVYFAQLFKTHEVQKTVLRFLFYFKKEGIKGFENVQEKNALYKVGKHWTENIKDQPYKSMPCFVYCISINTGLHQTIF